MDYIDCQLKLPAPMYEAALKLAKARDVTVGQILRDAFETRLRQEARNAKTPNRADERLLASLRTILAQDLAHSQSWSDLMNRFKAKGYTLREAGGGLAIHSHPTGTRLCKASELGYSYSDLMRRFQSPFPNHSHRYLAQKTLGHASMSEDVINRVDY